MPVEERQCRHGAGLESRIESWILRRPQGRMGPVPRNERLFPKSDGDYPLSDDDLAWQLELLQADYFWPMSVPAPCSVKISTNRAWDWRPSRMTDAATP